VAKIAKFATSVLTVIFRWALG